MSAALLLSLLLLQSQPPLPQAAGEVIAEVRVHGNYATPDAEVLRLAGITIGEPLQPDSILKIARRLRDSGRFQQVDVRKRYRSLTDTQRVVLILLVQEQPQAEDDLLPTNPLLKPFKRLPRRMQYLPIINFTDGYGFTYGLLTSFPDAVGKQSRVAVPLTWGAYRRAAVEVDKTFDRGLVNRIEGGAAIAVRENPFYREDDGRRQLWGRAERVLLPRLKLGGNVGWTHVKFEPFHDSFTTYGADLTLDTRRDPIFPRDAVYASMGWDALNFTRSTFPGTSFSGDAPSVHRTHTDLRGYIGLIGQSVLFVRGRLDTADGRTPPYEQPLLGGASSLRGFRAGAFAGDNRATAGVELRVPLSSPLGITRLGVSIFGDTGAVYDHGTRLRDATFHQGTGAGVFLLAPFLQLNFDVAYGFGNRLRVHFTSGFSF